MTPKNQTQLDSEELTTAHHDHSKALNSYAFYKIHDTEISEDLVQDTFAKTWAYLVKGGKIGMMRAFLYHVLNNLIVDQYRKGNHKTESLDDLFDGGFEQKDDRSESMINALDSKSTTKLIDRLPLLYKRIINMRFSKNLSLSEIAHITGKTKNAIAVQIHRGINKLRSLYNNH